jgi:hypothetical protein
VPRRSPTVFAPAQLDFLAAYPVPARPVHGPRSLACADLVCALTADAIRGSGRSRAEIAGHMSELTGATITVPMINALTAPSHGRHRLPLEWTAALETATDTYALSTLLAGQHGALLLVGEEARDAELGRIRRERAALAARERRLLGGLP